MLLPLALVFRSLLIALALCTLADPLFAAPTPRRWSQLTDVGFQKLTQEDGLPNEIALAVAEDGEGFIWVGTLGGLARWDGYRFRVYRADPRTPGALPDNYIQTLHGDAAGRLWIGTSSAGLVRYERQTDRFVAYPAGPQGLSHVNVRAIVDDGQGGLWVATEGGLDHVDPARGVTERGVDIGGLAGRQVLALLRDRRGTLWAGTPQGLFRRDAAGGGFVAVALDGGGAQPAPQALAEDSAGRLWIGTLHHGAWRIDPGGPARPVGKAPDAREISAIIEVRPGVMWLGSINQGIVVVDAASGQTRRIRHVPSLPGSLPDDTLRGLHRDRSGLVWVAGNHGLSRHDPRQSAIVSMFGAPAAAGQGATAQEGRGGIEISWILAMPDDRYWLGTHRSGVQIIDGSGARVGVLRPDASKPQDALPEAIVLALERVADGSVFIGTKRGLYRASADGRRVQRVTLAGRDPTTSTWALLADGDTLWIGGQTDGLWKLDLRSGQAQALLRDGAQQLSDERVSVLARAAGGRLWVGTRHGLNLYDPARGRVTQVMPDTAAEGGLSGGFVAALLTDRRQRLWVGTYGGGLNLLIDAPADAPPRFRQLSAPPGRPEDNVNALLEDAEGRIWASTDDGLVTLDPDSLKARTLRRAEGVAFPTYWTGSAARSAAGDLMFGGAGGMTIVRPDQLQAWTHRPGVLLTELEVGGQALPAGRWFGRGAATTPIEVPATANSLTVGFSATDFSAPERNRYAYRLQGFDDDWVESSATRRLASYTNLPPGRYTLRLRVSNRDGVWSTEELALPVKVLPAWHQTLAWRAALVLLALGLLLALLQARTRLLLARQRDLEAKVRERTQELETLSQALREKSNVLERTSITDPLTGLHNRRFLTEHIDAEIAANLRRRADASPAGRAVDTDSVFFLIDVDHFKRVNDLHGHAAGDAVLVEISARLRSALRESDHLVRWGGEEFLAVARDTDRARAEEVAERLRCAVVERPFEIEGQRRLTISCSIGFASMPFVARAPRALGWPEVVQVADIALRAAKTAGRDTWVGLLAGAALQPEGLMDRLRRTPQRTVQGGEIAISSRSALAEVLMALPAEGGRYPA